MNVLRLKNAAAACVIALGAVLAPAAAMAGQAKYVVLDMLPIQEGRTLAEAKAYMRDVEPILARHGMKRSDKILSVQQVMRGDFKAVMVNLWESDNPQASFQGVFNDPEYTENFPTRRDALFDMPNAVVVVTKRERKK